MSILLDTGNMMADYARRASRAQLVVPAPAVPAHAPGSIPIEEVDGAELLLAIAEWYDHYCKFPTLAGLDRNVLWAFMTWLRDEKGKPVIAAIARLMLLGGKGCGKSTGLQLHNLTCARTDGLALEPTPPAFRSMMGVEQLTALLDEGDVLLGNGNRKSEIRAVLNASTYPNGHVDRIQGGRRVKEPVFGPVAIAALPYLETGTGTWLEPLLDRSIVVRMSQPDEEVPQILEDPAGQKLGEKGGLLISMWIENHMSAILERIPDVKMPKKHRQAQIWRPLLAICDEAGGIWPDRGRDAMMNKVDAVSLASFRSGVASLSR